MPRLQEWTNVQTHVYSTHRFVYVFQYNCTGDYRDARALIGRELRHISL